MALPSLDELVEKYGQQTWHVCPKCKQWSLPIDWELDPPEYTGPCADPVCGYVHANPQEILPPPDFLNDAELPGESLKIEE